MNDQLKQVQEIIRAILFALVIVLLAIAAGIIFNSCTMSVIMTHTEGSASDVVDSDPKNEATPQLNVRIPSIP